MTFIQTSKRSFILITLLLFAQITFAQFVNQNNFGKVADSEKNKNLPLYLASGVIATGLLFEYSRIFDKEKFQAHALNQFPDFYTSVDDYFQFAPIAIGLGMSVSGIRGEHNFSKQIKRLLLAEAICNASVFTIKTQTAHIRPDGSSRNSFPSGHTAQAFCAAAFLDREYGKQYPWLRWLGYGMAATTGVCRILKNRHWASDVVLGAGIGYMSVDLSYRLFDRWEKNKNLQITPIIGNKTYGLRIVHNF